MLHSLLSQFDAVLKWGNSPARRVLARPHSLAHSATFAGISVIAWITDYPPTPYSVCLSRSEASGTPLCPPSAWLRRYWRSSSCCILSLTAPPTLAMLQGNNLQPALFKQDIVEREPSGIQRRNSERSPCVKCSLIYDIYFGRCSTCNS